MVVHVALRSATAGASLRFTTDGTSPMGKHGRLYLGPFFLYSEDCARCEVRAVAVKAGYLPSPVRSAVFEIEARVTEPALDPPGGTFVDHVAVAVALPFALNPLAPAAGDGGAGNGGEGYGGAGRAMVRWTVDDAEELGPGTVGADGAAADGYIGRTARPGDVVTLRRGRGPGPLTVTLRAMGVKAGFAPSAEVSARFVLKARAEAPVFSPNYTQPQPPNAFVLMESATPGATIVYTSDGSDPAQASEDERTCAPHQLCVVLHLPHSLSRSPSR